MAAMQSLRLTAITNLDMLFAGIAALSVLSASAAHAREWQGTMPKPIGRLPPYPPVVCVTPNWAPEPCESRQPKPEAKSEPNPASPEHVRREWECNMTMNIVKHEDLAPQVSGPSSSIHSI